MLEAKNLSRKYGDFLAVDDVSFTISSGEIVGLLGPNGAGKTTIMKMLSAYLEPDQGVITIDGLDLAVAAKTIQQNLGYLPESLPIYPEMTVVDYLDYAAELKGLSGARKEAEIRRVMQSADIGEKILAPIATLSRGFKQRVGVAQAILGNPRLLILDEPTNGLDPTQTELMRQLIKQLASTATIIISTHIMQEVDALCSRVLIVKDGRLAVDARLDELKFSRELELLTSLPPATLRDLLAPGTTLHPSDTNQGQESLSPADGLHYRITIPENADIDLVSAGLAEKIISQQGRLYRLSPLTRSLETLFREVNSRPSTQAREEFEHAA
ncbi:MAG: ABC transporter ATP-binding protein [Pseudomonadales bacterium]|nr:ABC transporter ATP-binding protein [Pseudomonadales bacterium]